MVENSDWLKNDLLTKVAYKSGITGISIFFTYRNAALLMHIATKVLALHRNSRTVVSLGALVLHLLL